MHVPSSQTIDLVLQRLISGAWQDPSVWRCNWRDSLLS